VVPVFTTVPIPNTEYISGIVHIQGVANGKNFTFEKPYECEDKVFRMTRLGQTTSDIGGGITSADVAQVIQCSTAEYKVASDGGNFILQAVGSYSSFPYNNGSDRRIPEECLKTNGLRLSDYQFSISCGMMEPNPYKILKDHWLYSQKFTVGNRIDYLPRTVKQGPRIEYIKDNVLNKLTISTSSDPLGNISVSAYKSEDNVLAISEWYYTIDKVDTKKNTEEKINQSVYPEYETMPSYYRFTLNGFKCPICDKNSESMFCSMAIRDDSRVANLRLATIETVQPNSTVSLIVDQKANEYYEPTRIFSTLNGTDNIPFLKDEHASVSGKLTRPQFLNNVISATAAMDTQTYETNHGKSYGLNRNQIEFSFLTDDDYREVKSMFDSCREMEIRTTKQ
jgi:hypothetical protein